MVVALLVDVVNVHVCLDECLFSNTVRWYFLYRVYEILYTNIVLVSFYVYLMLICQIQNDFYIQTTIVQYKGCILTVSFDNSRQYNQDI